jgi:formylglycine-generating enzyme required for sulfatase activity
MRNCSIGFAVASIAVVGTGYLLTRPRPESPAQARRWAAAVPAGMVFVPGGDALLGTDDSDADDDVRPHRRQFVAAFYIDRDEVTHAQYARFRPDHRFLPGQERLPVTNVTYADAEAYARWAGKRLPTEDEWEKAARGTDGRRYPWGDMWEPSRVAARARGGPQVRASNGCLIRERVRPVGTRAAGASPYGCRDMAGNAWEWVQGHFNGNPEQRILRGGAVGYGERACRTYARAIEGAGVT